MRAGARSSYFPTTNSTGTVSASTPFSSLSGASGPQFASHERALEQQPRPVPRPCAGFLVGLVDEELELISVRERGAGPVNRCRVAAFA